MNRQKKGRNNMRTAKEVAAIAAKALDSKKGIDLRLIEISDISTLADYFLICTASSNTHVLVACMLLMTPMYLHRVTIQTLGYPRYAVIAGILQFFMRTLTVAFGPALIGVYAYYIQDGMAWLASLPVLRFGLRSNPPSGPKIEARTITAVLPDTGDRYLSTPLFAD